ncbi:hypothetical protein PVL29_020608 [Vitis rotundifolia]|uniref:O-fucosyltransferase family protein n=1 Tax=Vitis rotundifolia TaxID=103349 RepID=A0AA38YXE1_VITRO|nr:hypothetical protein PVL29_020608 [Vitis rotundifolia]
MVAIARFLNVTLIIPKIKPPFGLIQVRILKELPPRLKTKVELGMFYSLPPVSWSNISYHLHQILPLVQKHKVVNMNKTDAHLANNGLPLEIQKLLCRVNFSSLRLTSQIEELGRRVVRILRENGPFLVLHLSYEMDMLAFSSCIRSCNDKEAEELARMRYAYPWWKEKIIDSKVKSREGLCPLTLGETALILSALGIIMFKFILLLDKYMVEKEEWPVQKETVLKPSDLRFFQNHISQMAALDYLVSLESDIFVPTYDGNMAKGVEGHCRFLGFKKTIQLDRRLLVNLADENKNGGAPTTFRKMLNMENYHRMSISLGVF